MTAARTGLVFALVLAWAVPARAENPPGLSADSYSNGETADVVLAQPDLNSGTAGTSAGAVTLSTFPVALSSVVAAGIAFDRDGNLWLADVGNNRVLRFPVIVQDGVTTLATAEAADLVLGQADLDSMEAGTSASGLRRPTRVSFDAAGDLWVSDTGNNRMLHFTAPFSNGQSADQALGQTGLGAGACGLSQTALCGPSGIVFDDMGGAWVADTDNNRVIHFAAADLVTGGAADVIVGTDTYTSRFVHRPDGLCNAPNCEAPENVVWFPFAVALAPNGDLFVADHESSRVLRFSSPVVTGQGASLVLGQTGFAGSSPALGPGRLSDPMDLSFDGAGRVWAADFGNNRILRYDPPFSNGMAAAVVLGQSDFDSKVSGTGPGQLRGPTSVALDPLGDVWVADALNNRVVGFFSTAFSTSTPATADSLTVHLGINFNAPGTLFDCQVDSSTTFDSPALQSAPSLSPDTDVSFTGLQGGATYYLRCALAGTTEYRVLGSRATGICNGPFEYDFTQVTLRPTKSLILSEDVDELRDLIDDVRADAGLSAFAWTDPALFTSPGALVRAQHVQELRDALGEVYTACGQSAPTYADAVLIPGVSLIRSSQITEVRAAAADVR